MKLEVIKRDKRRVAFDKQKIIDAILKAFQEVDGEVSDYAKIKAEHIADYIEQKAIETEGPLSIEDIQNLCENGLMSTKRKNVARAYIRYRYQREASREIIKSLENRYNKVFSLITGNDKESKEENSNKNTEIIPTMRDYIAGFTCREMADNLILPKEISDAHREGIIHFHDTDYSPAMPMSNCCLINLEDMLQNGTIISETMIEKPHSFRTACTIVTQIITQVASSQYGGNTITLSHLAPFVDISRQKIRKEVESEIDLALEYIADDWGFKYNEVVSKITEDRLKKEIADGIQTIQYQLITMSTTNG